GLPMWHFVSPPSGLASGICSSGDGEIAVLYLPVNVSSDASLDAVLAGGGFLISVREQPNIFRARTNSTEPAGGYAALPMHRTTGVIQREEVSTWRIAWASVAVGRHDVFVVVRGG